MKSRANIRDTTPGGQPPGTHTQLEFPAEIVTVREILREHVYQCVADLNVARLAQAERHERYGGRVRVSELEASLNGTRKRAPEPVDWHAAFERVLRAYEAGEVLLLVGDRQAAGLDERVELRLGEELTFLRLVPIEGLAWYER